MSDPAAKKRQSRAKRKAIDHYRSLRYQIIMSDNAPFSFEAIYHSQHRYVRAVDEITENDIRLVKACALPSDCIREIFCLKGARFEIREVRG